MMHPVLRKGAEALLLVSGGIFVFLTALTVTGVVLIVINGGQV